MLRVSGLKLSIEDDSAKLASILLKKLDINREDLMEYKIFKKSVDARQRDSMIFFNYTVDAALKNEEAVLKRLYSRGVAAAPDMKYVTNGPRYRTVQFLDYSLIVALMQG